MRNLPAYPLSFGQGGPHPIVHQRNGEGPVLGSERHVPPAIYCSEIDLFGDAQCGVKFYAEPEILCCSWHEWQIFSPRHNSKFYASTD